MSVRKEVSVDLDEDAAGAAASAAVVDEDAAVAVRPALPADVVDEDVDPLDKLPPRAIPNADGSVTLPLLYPKELQIRKLGKIRTDRFDSLTFHRLTGADQRAIAATSEETMSVVAFARSTRLSQAVMNALFDKMDGADIAAGGQVLNSFFATGRTTGR
ncbi:hypothetical protein [Mesorhizobium sp. 1M-11]|uniref:hypothetical protein n=1 Tax=Mesorhizobium sp. 1M-11 TaxID=1529006 RepID=UPI000AC3F19A|nr:hypothetical protein [Mesorhizobium sp. 1M-11]